MSQGPVEIKGRALASGALRRAQNRTITHAWRIIRRNGYRSFLIADAVGRGKSFMALAVAMGLWRQERKRTFRLLIIAPSRELSSAWLDKLAGRRRSGRFSEVVTAPGMKDNFFSNYLPEFRRATVTVSIVSLRSSSDVNRVGLAWSDPEAEQVLRRRWGQRIEIVIASPRFLAMKGKPDYWRRWASGADAIIADEVYGARRSGTTYRRLLAPHEFGASPRFARRRPWLIGLSATLLSRDMADCRDVVRLFLQWGCERRWLTPKFEARRRALDAACSDYNKVLAAARQEASKIKDRLPPAIITSYNRARKALEDQFRPILSRVPHPSSRTFEFWLTHPGTEWKSHATNRFPLEHVQFTQNGLLERTDRMKLAADLAGFVTRAGAAPLALDKQPHRSWLRYSESGDAGAPGPKYDALSRWLEEHTRKIASDPATSRFKILVYCHHVDTAQLLGREKNDSLAERVDKALKDGIWEMSVGLPELFKHRRPRPALRLALKRKGFTALAIRRLLKRNPTAVFAAMLSARASRPHDRIKAFVGTVGEYHAAGATGALGRLRSNEALRCRVLAALGFQRLADATKQTSKKDKKRRAMFWSIFEHEYISEILGRVKLKKGQSYETSIVDCLQQDGYARWRIWTWERSFRKLKKHAARLARMRQAGHRGSKVVEVLTGRNPERRVPVSRDFLSPGNPYVLALTNVCSMGVDLHEACWDVIHYSPSWTPSDFEQKSGRIDRPRPRQTLKRLGMPITSSSDKIRIHHLIWPFTYDERVLKRMNARAHLSERLLGKKEAAVIDDETALRLRELRRLSLEPI